MAKRKVKRPVETIIIVVVLSLLAIATALYVYLTFRATIVKNTLNKEADRYFSILYVDHDDTLLVSDCYGEGLVRKTPPTPTREDHDFLGWSMNNSLKVYSTAETYNMTIDRDVIFKAVYQQRQLTVNYLDSDMSLIQSFVYKSSETMPTIPNPTKEGYIFTGWDVAVNGSTTTCVAMYCDETSNYVCRVGNTYYTDIAEAAHKTENATVVLFADVRAPYCYPKAGVTIKLAADVVWTHNKDTHDIYSAIVFSEAGCKIDTNGYTLKIVSDSGAIEAIYSIEVIGSGKLETSKVVNLTQCTDLPEVLLTITNATVVAPIQLTNKGTYIKANNIGADSRITITSQEESLLDSIANWQIIKSSQKLQNICSIAYLEHYGKYYKLSENYNEETKEYYYTINTSVEVVKTTIRYNNQILSVTGYAAGSVISCDILQQLTGLAETSEDGKLLTFIITRTIPATSSTVETTETETIVKLEEYPTLQNCTIKSEGYYDIVAEYQSRAELGLGG